MKRATRSILFIFSLTSVLVLGLSIRAQAKECTNATVKGLFGFTCEGTIVGVGPISIVGVEVSDGQGNASGTQTVSLNGQIFSGVSFTEKYTVNPDCTVSAIVTLADGSTSTSSYVIVENGKEVRGILTDPGTVVSCVIRRQ